MPSDPILSAFDRRRRRWPDAPMLVSRRHEASASEIDCLARAAGAELERGGLVAGDLIGLAAPNGPGFVAGLLAIRRASAAALLFDGRTPDSEKLRTARSLRAAALLDCRMTWPRGADDFSLRRVASRRSARSLPQEIAVVKLTSGSTGSPRGILTPSAALVADDAALAATMHLDDEERIMAAIPMSHSYGLSSVVMPALMRCSVLVLPEENNPFDPMIVGRARGVTFLPTVPAYLQALVRMSQPPRAPSSLRLVVSAGAPLKPSTAASFRRIYRLPVHVFYGASECGGITFDRTGTAGERGSLGTPVEGVQLTIEPVPEPGLSAPDTADREIRERGTVTVTSSAVARGYLPETDLSLADGRFRTRDLGVLCEGELFLEGRLDQLINVRGKKVDPREVEAVLGRLEGVDEVVTLGVTPPGQDEEIVRSVVACRPGQLSYQTIQAWCRRHLADYKVPRSIILLEEIPRTDRGKLDRAAILALEPKGQPDRG